MTMASKHRCQKCEIENGEWDNGNAGIQGGHARVEKSKGSTVLLCQWCWHEQYNRDRCARVPKQTKVNKWQLDMFD